MRVRVLSILAIVCFAVVLFGLVGAEEVKHEYIGATKCKMCHKKDGTFESWAATKHATAWDSLSAEDQKSEEIKKFYTTGTTAKDELLTGVQCEACHGPGSDYKSKKIMEDREQAVANGLVIPDEKTCLKCHNADAPAALAATAKDFNFEKMRAAGVHAMPEKAAEETKK